MSRADTSKYLPLSTPVFHILLSLGQARLHGYAIMQAIEEKTDGAVEILPGTLYTTLNRMLADGLVEEVPAPAGEPDDARRRRYYRTTGFGREVAAAEAERMSLLVELARRDLEPS